MDRRLHTSCPSLLCKRSGELGKGGKDRRVPPVEHDCTQGSFMCSIAFDLRVIPESRIPPIS